MRLHELLESIEDRAYKDFQKFLFGDIKSANEKDTKLEKEIYDIIKDYMFNNTKERNAAAKDVLDYLHQYRNVFPDDLIPDSDTVYRGTNVTDEFYHFMAREHQLEDDERSGKVDFNNINWYKTDYVYKPKSFIQSWTTKFRVAEQFSGDHTNSVILEAKVDDDFILSTALSNLISKDAGQGEEHEIIRISGNPINTIAYIDRYQLESFLMHHDEYDY